MRCDLTRVRFGIRSLTWSALHLFRNPSQQDSHHGEAGTGPVRAVPPGRVPRGPRRSHQQKDLARDYQGTQSSVVHNLRGLHPSNAVSWIFSSLFRGKVARRVRNILTTGVVFRAGATILFRENAYIGKARHDFSEGVKA